ncbi:MAG: 1-acyl-sn-glycerol-3-phosphate acyltransferase, partial [Pseudohongiellaceae bacterium]
MSRILFLGFRSTVFYTVYVASLLIHSSLCLAAGPFLSIQSRYRFFTLWNRFVMLWLRIACGIRFQVTGIDNIPPAPYVVLSNHQSPWETIYFYILFQPVCAILKKELLSIPFFGWGMRLLQPIAIDRSKKRFARNQLL